MTERGRLSGAVSDLGESMTLARAGFRSMPGRSRCFAMRSKGHILLAECGHDSMRC